MGPRFPTLIVIVLVALCGVGIASIFLPWAVIDLLGAEIPLPGHQVWTGRVSGIAFGVLAVACIVQIIWPRLPRFVPLALAVVVGLGVAGLGIGPNLVYGYAEMSIAGRPQSIPEAIGAGKYLASGAGLLAAVTAIWQLWRGGPAASVAASNG